MRPIATLVRTLAKRSIACKCQATIATTHQWPLVLARALSSTAQQAHGTSAASSTVGSAVRSQQNRFSTLPNALVDSEEETTTADEVTLEPLSVDEEATNAFANLKPISDFDLSATLQRNLEREGITHFFPVQAQSFSIMTNGKDIVGRSKTGSGKTLAFGIPLVEKLLAEPRARKPQALILLPTRELAQQVLDALQKVAPQLRLVNVVGGMPYQPQERELKRGCDILVGTPGRIIDLMKKGTLDLAETRTVILDEADMMLKFGFQEEVETIFHSTHEERQCVMWSATFPKWVESMAKKFLKNAVHIDLVGENDNQVPATVAHKAINAPIHSRVKILENVLRQHAKNGQALVFTETKQEADDIANALGKHDARSLHGDLSQGMRSSTMQGFRDGTIKILVCTDVAARGLDIASVDLVVQYRLPSDKESFVHRAGRTGRAGRSGTNIVFFDQQDAEDVFQFEKRYHFEFAHMAPPSVEQVVNVALDEVQDKLQQVPSRNSQLFVERAQQLLQEENGVKILSSALALLCGFDNQRLGATSMISGRSGMKTMQFVGFEGIQDAARLLSIERLVDRRDFRSISDGRIVADVPVANLPKVEELCEMQGVTASAVEELPRVLVTNQGRARSYSDDFSSRRRDGNQRGWGRNDRRGDRFSGRSNGRFTDRNDRSHGRFTDRFSDRSNDRNDRANQWRARLMSDDSWKKNSGRSDRKSGFDDKFSRGSSSKKDWRNFDW